MSTISKKSAPVHQIRLGRIRAAIWENETQNGKWYNVTVTRIFKDGEEWRDSSSFGRDDLPLVAKVVDRCHSWIFEQLGAVSANSNGDGSSATGDESPF